MSRRKLRPEERELWHQVAKTAVPMHPSKRKESPQLLQDEGRRKEPIPEPIASFEIGEKAKTASRIPPSKAGAVRMDAKAYRKLARGKLQPEGKMDLHGMTVDQAHSELKNFILRSHAKGRRLVLVITGKGRSADGFMPFQRGVLRRQVPLWLEQLPLAPLVLQVSTASPKHGGEGALYVYLRRQR